MDYLNYGYQKLRGVERKHYLIRQRGSKCEKCGYSKNFSALEFHHLRDKKIRLDFRSLSSNKLEKIEEEFEKCLVLCANCHRELHHPQQEIDDIENYKQEILNEIDGNKQYLNKITQKHKSKNTCCDCGNEIDKQAKRCKSCYINVQLKNAKKPNSFQELKNDVEQYGIMECSRRYNVSHTTIRRWLGRKKDRSIPKHIIS
jgi:uncharacterized coiled-coil DUF342 family protein